VDEEWAQEMDLIIVTNTVRYCGSGRSFSHYSVTKHEAKCGGSISQNWGPVKHE
jgi:hypothetical protein